MLRGRGQNALVPKPKVRSTQSSQPSKGLVCFASAAVALPKGEIPDRLLIAPWGRSETDTGPVIVNEATIAGLAKHNRHPFDTVALDFVHNTEKGDGQEPKPVAAYGRPEVIRGEGLMLTNLEWTPDGRTAWENRWYKDTSPTIARNAKGEVIFVKSAALCRNGRIPGLENFDANNTNEPKFMLNRSLAIALLNKSGANLPDDATEEQIAAAADAASGEGSGPGPAEDHSADLKKQFEQFQADFKSAMEAMRKDLANEKASQAKERKMSLIDQASREGKVIPFSNDDILAESFSVDMLEKCIANLPAGQVPFKAGSAGAKEPLKKGEAFSDVDMKIADCLGLSAEDLEHYGAMPDHLRKLPQAPQAA